LKKGEHGAEIFFCKAKLIKLTEYIYTLVLFETEKALIQSVSDNLMIYCVV